MLCPAFEASLAGGIPAVRADDLIRCGKQPFVLFFSKIVDDGFHTVAFLMFVHCGFAHPQNKSYRNLPDDQYFRYHDALRRTQDASRYEKKPSINALMKEPVWRWQSAVPAFSPRRRALCPHALRGAAGGGQGSGCFILGITNALQKEPQNK